MGKEIIARGQAVVVCQKDGYTINQSVGEYIFTALNNGTIPSAVTIVSTIKVTSGDSTVTNFTIGTINKPTGFASINVNNANKTITYTVAANTTTLADNGTVLIPIIIEGNTYTVSFKWAKSKDGQNGSNGVGIKSIVNKYAVSASNTVAPTSWGTTVPTMTATTRYLWNYEIVTYTNNSVYETEKRVIGVYGDKGETGETGKGVSSVDVLYYLSTSSTTQTDGSWSTTAPTWVNGKYMWSKTKITYTDGSAKETNPVCITGAKGNTGNTGATGAAGKGIKSIVEQYYLSTSNTSQAGGSWTNTPPAWANGKYMWTRSIITYTDNSTTTTTPICVSGSTGATGNGILSITEYYLASASSSGVTTSTSGWTTTVQTTSTSKKYLWNYEVVQYTNGSKYTSTPVIIGTYGATGPTGPAGKPGTDGYTVSASRNSYIVSTDKDGRIHTAVTTNTTISILKGSTPVTPTIGALPTVAGCTLSKSGATVTIVFNVGTSLAENGTISIPVVADGKSFAVSFSYAKARAGAAGADSNMLDWVKDWNNNKTQINENSVITPKIFAGTKNSNGTLTGVAMGKFSLSVLNSSGVVTTETINGIYGFKDGYKTFYVNNTGDAGLGRGNQFIRYNATTGKIEFGSDVSLNWTQPIETINTALGGKGFPKLTYIDGKGIYTGTLTAEQVNAVNINASSIKTGTLSADRIAAGSIKSDKLDANSIKANIINTAYIQGLTLNFTKGTIGGWTIDGDSIFRGTKSNTSGTYTSASGAITIGSNGIRGFKWKLDSSGAGALAGGNISWDIDGNVMFGKSVSLQWTDCIDKALNNIAVESKVLAEAWQTKINKNEYLKIPIKTALLKNTTYTWSGIGWGLAESDDYNDFNESVKQYTIGIYNATQLKYVVLKNVSTILPTELENYDLQLRGTAYLMTDDSFLDTDSFELHVYSHIKDKPVTASNGLLLYVAGLIEGTVLLNLQPRLTHIDATGIYTGTIQAQQITAGTISAHLIGAGSITADKIASRTITADKIRAGAITANEIKVGTITSTQLDANSIKTNIINTSYIQGLTLNFTKGKIGGWNISENAISKNSVSLGSDGSITNGTKWKLNNDGSGQLANGNIKWDTLGNIIFSSSGLGDIANQGEIYVRGSSYQYAEGPQLYINGKEILINSKWWRSFCLVVVSRNDLSVVSIAYYDTYQGEGNTCNELASVLNNLDSNKLVILISNDAITVNDNLNNAIKKCGGKDWTGNGKRSAYAFIGISGVGENNGISAYKHAEKSCAEISTKVINGIPQGFNTGTLTASQINAANCNFTQGKIGGFTIYGHKISTYDNPTDGHIIEIHKTGYICNSRKSDSKDYWALNADGSATFGITKAVKFNADGSGSVATNGISWNANGVLKVGGFEIGYNRIGSTATQSGGGGSLAIYNDFLRIGSTDSYVLFGNNVFPATSSSIAAGRVVNTKSNSYYNNYGIHIDVKNGKRNFGIYSNAPILANACIGNKIKTMYFSGSTYTIDFSQANIFIVYANRDISLTLPTSSEVASMFGYSTLPSDFGYMFTFIYKHNASYQISINNLIAYNGETRTHNMRQGDVTTFLCTNYPSFHYQMMYYFQ
jgi:hypothetical protein